MTKRPISISVISWFMIVTAGLSLTTSTASLNNPAVREFMGRSPIPTPIQYVMLDLGLTISIISGIMMLKGRNWARLLYVIWGAVGSVIGLATSPMKTMMIPGIALLIIFSFFLFRPKANEYFKTS